MDHHHHDDDEGQFLSWKKEEDRLNALRDLGSEEQVRLTKSLPLIPLQPQTPKEPMEFLSRSWSISAEEISKALANKHKHFLLENNTTSTTIPELESITSPPPPPPPLLLVADSLTRPNYNNTNSSRMRAIGKWFHHRDPGSGSMKKRRNKKDRERAGNAHTHAAVSVAGLAAALAAVTAAAADNNSSSNAAVSPASKMSGAVASAAELLASHCIEIAEMAGADRDRVASIVRSAVDVTSPGDLMTLTAAAATALRGEAALRARLPKEPKRNAAISPCDATTTTSSSSSSTKTMADIQYLDPFHNEVEDLIPPCAGELLQHTRKGGLRWKRASVYINKKSQVMIKLKSKHVGGALTKNDKCVVYGVCDQTAAWTFGGNNKGGGGGDNNNNNNNLESYFGLKTAQGFLEFKCKNKLHKQQWIDGIRSLLHQVGCAEGVANSLDRLTVSTNHKHH